VLLSPLRDLKVAVNAASHTLKSASIHFGAHAFFGMADL
jgi:hypothetical protein